MEVVHEKAKHGEITAPAEPIEERESFPSWRLIYTCKYVKSQLPLKPIHRQHLGTGELLPVRVIHRNELDFNSQGEFARPYLGHWQHQEFGRRMEIMDQADKNVGEDVCTKQLGSLGKYPASHRVAMG